MIFTSDEVTSENRWQITSRVTKNIIHGNEYIVLFLARYFFSPEHTILLKTIIDSLFRHGRQGQSFLT